MDSGLKKAIEVPLSLMRLAHGCWPHMMTLAEHGNITTLSDLKVTNHVYIHTYIHTYIHYHTYIPYTHTYISYLFALLFTIGVTVFYVYCTECRLGPRV